QAIIGHNFFGRPVPTSIVQLWVPRVELHLFYNAIVFIPMVIAMYYHMFPSSPHAVKQQCTCAWHGSQASAVSGQWAFSRNSSSQKRSYGCGACRKFFNWSSSVAYSASHVVRALAPRRRVTAATSPPILPSSGR